MSRAKTDVITFIATSYFKYQMLSSLAIQLPLLISLLGVLRVTIATIKIDPVNKHFVDEYKRSVPFVLLML